MKNITKAISQIDNMADLNVVISALKQQQKILKAQGSRKARATFRVGDICNIRSNSGLEKCEITDIRRTKASIKIGSNHYTCSLTMLEAI